MTFGESNIKTLKLEQWQTDRIKFYQESEALDFINNYFNVKKGVRCIVGHMKDMYALEKQPTYRVYNNNMCRAQTVPDVLTGKYTPLINYWTVHSYMYVFDKRVLEWTNIGNRKDIMTESLIGINGVIELDSPEEPNSDKAKRTSFFDHVSEFDNAIDIVDKKLTEFGEDYNLQFSGNGIYIMLEGFYDDNLKDYIDNFINLIDNLREFDGLGCNMKVHVDNRAAPWNDYFKCPFTFHEKRPRISIPLPKGELDRDYINEVSDIKSIMCESESGTLINEYLIDEVIKKANWRKIW